MSIGTYIRVWDAQGGSADVDAADEGRIDAAVQRFIETGGHVDTVLDLTMLNGASYRVLASTIQSWIVSTPDTRLRQMELQKESEEEEREYRVALGLPWEGED